MSKEFTSFPPLPNGLVIHAQLGPMFDRMQMQSYALKMADAATLRQQAARVDEGMLRDVLGNVVKSMRATGRSWGPTRQAQVLDTWADEIETTIEAALSAQPAPGPRFSRAVWRGKEWIPCYCAGTADHHIGAERPAAPVGVPDGSTAQNLRKAIGIVCEGFTLPEGARKVLESALWAAPSAQQGENDHGL